MLGQLPRKLNVAGRDYSIRTDFRDILCIIAAFGDDALTDREKVYVCLKKLYKDFDALPPDDYAEAYRAAMRFIECEQPESQKPSPKIVSWEKDDQLLFAAVNKVAGFEVRLTDYLHWYTFMGFFQGIGSEDTYGYILMLRQKKARGKKLEKHELEFWNQNRAMCVMHENAGRAEKAENDLKTIYESLLKGGD